MLPTGRNVLTEVDQEHRKEVVVIDDLGVQDPRISLSPNIFRKSGLRTVECLLLWAPSFGHVLYAFQWGHIDLTLYSTLWEWVASGHLYITFVIYTKNFMTIYVSVHSSFTLINIIINKLDFIGFAIMKQWTYYIFYNYSIKSTKKKYDSETLGHTYIETFT